MNISRTTLVLTTIVSATLISSCGKGDDTGEISSPWSILADEVGEGVLLSAWSNGSEVLMVGGGMDGDGPGVIAHYNPNLGTICTETAVDDRAIWWIHGVEEDNWYAVGEGGMVIHSENGVRTREDVESDSTLYGVWAADNGDVWAVGGTVGNAEFPKGLGEIWHRDADTEEWVVWVDELPGTIYKVWNGWFVGNEVAYFIDPDDKSVFEDRDLGPHRILTVRGHNQDEVWAVGGAFSATILSYAGGAWVEEPTDGLNLPLNGIWTAPDEDIWVTGMSGTMGVWSLEDEAMETPSYPLTMEHFHAVWKHNDEVLFMGGNLLGTGPDYYGTVGRYGSNIDPIVATPCE